MSCNNTNPFITYNVQYSQAGCDACSDPACGGVTMNSKCVVYTGAALPCSGIDTNDSVETALQKIDAQVCSIIGDYSTYNTYCLAPITTQQEFVEAISDGYCTLLTNYNTFVNTTFVNYQTTVDSRFDAIEVPGITCVAASVVPTDNLVAVLTKYCSQFGNIENSLDISGVNWAQCFAVPIAPTTIAEGFDLLIDQICSIEAGTATLPTFNNVGSCLPTPGANDSLVDTINKIKTRLCQTGTFDINALTWGCIAQPSVVATDLQAAFQEVLDQLNDYIQNKLTFSADFTVSQTNPMDVCDGLTVELATPVVNNDRLVAATPTDLTPGTLQDKLVAGTNVALDYITNPDQVTINVTGVADTYQVKANAADTSPDFLDQKVQGINNTTDGISISTAYNGGTEQVDFNPSINWSIFINKFLDEVEANPALKIKFCTMVQDCVDNDITCNGYTVSMTPAQISANGSASFSYTDCNNVVQVVNLIYSGPTSVDICAIKNTVNAVGLIVIDGGACVGSTTTTTTSTTTTTTTTTSTTTTTTTTAAPSSFFYEANIFVCSACTAGPTNQLVESDIALTVGQFYITDTGEVAEILNSTGAGSPVYTLTSPTGFGSCGAVPCP